MTRRVVVVPSAPALLPQYAGAEDPVPEVRKAALTATAWLCESGAESIGVVAAPQRADNRARGVAEPAGVRIGRELLRSVGAAAVIEADLDRASTADALLVVANGSATRSEKAPGHLDERAFAFDDELDRALRAGDAEALAGIDAALGEALWCFDVPAFHALAGSVAGGRVEVSVDHDDDPFGVRYWVVRWTCES